MNTQVIQRNHGSFSWTCHSFPFDSLVSCPFSLVVNSVDSTTMTTGNKTSLIRYLSCLTPHRLVDSFIAILSNKSQRKERDLLEFLSPVLFNFMHLFSSNERKRKRGDRMTKIHKIRRRIHEAKEGRRKEKRIKVGYRGSI